MNEMTIYRQKNLNILFNTLLIYIYIIVTFLMSYYLTNENFTVSLFYCAVVLIAVVFAVLAENYQNNVVLYTFFIFASFLVLFFIYGFRNFSANDDINYIRIFEQVSFMGWYEYFKYSTMEPGYLILNSIVNLFTNNYLYMQLLTSFIPLALIYYGLNKYKKIINLPTAVFLLCSMLYFQMLATALVRMFIALAIVFVALRHIPERRPIRYIILIVIASTFHYSSFFMLVLTYFAINKSNLSKKVWRFYRLTFILSPFIFVFIGRFIVPLLGSRYRGYGQIDSINLNIGVFSTLPLIILLLIHYKRFNEKEQLYFKIFMFVYSLSIVISLFGNMISLGRLIYYSYSAFILGSAMVVKKAQYGRSKFTFTAILILYGILYLFYTQLGNDSRNVYLFPYDNIFFSL